MMNTERRNHPRIAKSVPLKICQDNGDIITESGNISRSGLYCRINKYIEPMTKIKTHLLLPFRRGGRSATKKVTCQGVVVRIEEITGQDNYNIAIFFSDISPKDSEVISDFINSALEKSF